MSVGKMGNLMEKEKENLLIFWCAMQTRNAVLSSLNYIWINQSLKCISYESEKTQNFHKNGTKHEYTNRNSCAQPKSSKKWKQG